MQRNRHMKESLFGLLVFVLSLPMWADAGARAPGALLTSIADIRALSLEDASLKHRVRVRGIVTHFDEQRGAGLIIHDGRRGQYVQQAASGIPGWRLLRLGDVIEVEGETKRGGYAPNVHAQAIRVLARGPMPAAAVVPYSALLTGRHDCDYVQLVGTVQRAWDHGPGRTLFAEIAAEGGIVRASFWGYAPADIAWLVGAEVRLVGNAGTLQDEAGQLRGVSMLVNRTRDVTVLKPAAPPFSLPAQSLGTLYRHRSSSEPFGRSRVSGVVTAYVPGRRLTVKDNASGHDFSSTAHVLYIQDRTGVARVETDQPTAVSPGDRIDVAGFPHITPGKPVLQHAVFRVVGSEAYPDPVVLPTPLILTPDRDASLVSLRARLLGVVASGARRVLVLEVGEGLVHATLHGLPRQVALDRITPGSVVTVTGVYAYQHGSPPSFRLFLRSPGDVVVVQAAPWWTLGHTAVLGAMLIAVGGATGVWVWTSGRRRRQRFQAILDERTRVARELHDTLEQGLAGIALQLEAVTGTLGSATDRARRPLDLARQMLRYSLEEARRSVLDLRSQALETADLAGALADMAAGMASTAGVTADVRIVGEPRRLDAEREHHLLRIGLEAVTNALKHARPGRIDIELRFTATTVDLVVRDDGCGMASGEASAPVGQFGLRGIRERVDKLGGALRIDSGHESGTTLAVTVPFRSDRWRIA